MFKKCTVIKFKIYFTNTDPCANALAEPDLAGDAGGRHVQVDAHCSTPNFLR